MPRRYIATLAGAEHELEVEELAANSLRVKFGGTTLEADVRRVGPASYSILVNNRCFDFDVVHDGEEMLVASRGGTTRVTLTDVARRGRRGPLGARPLAVGRAELKAMMPGRVVHVLVAVGDEVAAYQGVLVLEAMKMENELKSPKAGKIVEVRVVPGQTVEKGELLAVID